MPAPFGYSHPGEYSNSLRMEYECERFQKRWEEAHGAVESDLENIAEYVKPLAEHGPKSMDNIAEAKAYAIKLVESLDALERLAR